MPRHYAAIAVAAALGVALAGCDDKPKTTKDARVTIKIGNTTIRAADEHAPDVALPSGMPAYAAVYPGANVRTVVAAGEDGLDIMVSYTTTSKPQDVLAFYKKNAEAAGLDTVQEMQGGGVWNYAAQKKEGDGMVAVIIVAEKNRSAVQVTFK